MATRRRAPHQHSSKHQYLLRLRPQARVRVVDDSLHLIVEQEADFVSVRAVFAVQLDRAVVCLSISN
jgi:hypothetical protein